MPTNHTKAIKGLSIAVLVLSILVIVGSIFFIIMLTFAGSYSISYYYGSSYHSYSNHGPAMLAIGIEQMFFVWVIITGVVSLIAAILGMRNAGSPTTYQPIFIWSIVGASLSFVTFMRLPSMVLLIILAVFLYQDRKAALEPPRYNPAQPYGAPYNTYYGQPYNGQAYNQPGAAQGYGQPAGVPVYGQPQNATNAGYGGQNASFGYQAPNNMPYGTPQTPSNPPTPNPNVYGAGNETAAPGASSEEPSAFSSDTPSDSSR